MVFCFCLLTCFHDLSCLSPLVFLVELFVLMGWSFPESISLKSFLGNCFCSKAQPGMQVTLPITHTKAPNPRATGFYELKWCCLFFWDSSYAVKQPHHTVWWLCKCVFLRKEKERFLARQGCDGPRREEGFFIIILGTRVEWLRVAQINSKERWQCMHSEGC